MSVEQARTDGAEAAEALLRAVEEFKGRLSIRITAIAASIATDEDGNVLATPENIERVNDLIAQMKSEFLDEEFVDAVTDYVEGLDGITSQVTSAFDDFDGVREDVLRAIGVRYKQETAGYLTDANSYNESLWSNVADGLIYGVATNSAIGALAASVGNVSMASNIVGAVASTVESAPLLLQRAQTVAAAEQVGAQFFLYQGRPIPTTRAWCREREGKYWHIEEIREWGREAANGNGWDGMVEGTNEQTIFSYLGGWYGERNSCRHVLVPVLRAKVPAADLDRMRSKGLVK